MELTEQMLARSLYGISEIVRVQGEARYHRGPRAAYTQMPGRDDLLEQAGMRPIERRRVTERYPRENHPYVIAMHDDGDVSLYFSGVQERGQFADVAAGYVLPESIVSPMQKWNFYVQSIAVPLADVLVGTVNQLAKYYVFGHSLGGMIAEAVASRLTFGGRRVESLITYGTPRPAMVGAYRAEVWQYHLRWMADNDPVPLLPFGDVGQPAAVGAVVVPRLRLLPDFNPAEWRHAGVGLAISNVAIRQSTDPRGTVNPMTTLAGWAREESRGPTPHEAESYQNLLAGWWDARVGSTTRTRPNGAVAPPTPTPRLMMPFRLPESYGFQFDLVRPLDLTPTGRASLVESPIARRVPQAVGQASAINAAAARGVGAMANAVLAPNAGFTRAKMPGYGWVIYFRGMMVGAVQSGSRARTFCKKGNALIRYMNNLAWTPSIGDAWTAAINAYIAGQGYNPPMSPLT